MRMPEGSLSKRGIKLAFSFMLWYRSGLSWKTTAQLTDCSAVQMTKLRLRLRSEAVSEDGSVEADQDRLARH